MIKVADSNRMVDETVVYSNPKVQRVKIASGSPYSDPFNFGDVVSVGVILDGDEWTTDSDLMFQVSADRQTWVTAVDDDGTAIKCTNISSGAPWARAFPDAMKIYPYPYVRLYTTNKTTGEAMNQTSDRYLFICAK
jgi:hypothetical protein